MPADALFAWSWRKSRERQRRADLIRMRVSWTELDMTIARTKEDTSPSYRHWQCWWTDFTGMKRALIRSTLSTPDSKRESVHACLSVWGFCGHLNKSDTGITFSLWAESKKQNTYYSRHFIRKASFVVLLIIGVRDACSSKRTNIK